MLGRLKLSKAYKWYSREDVRRVITSQVLMRKVMLLSSEKGEVKPLMHSEKLITKANLNAFETKLIYESFRNDVVAINVSTELYLDDTVLAYEMDLDVDSKNEDWREAKEVTETLINLLEENNCPFLVYFSGRRGFHVLFSYKDILSGYGDRELALKDERDLKEELKIYLKNALDWGNCEIEIKSRRPALYSMHRTTGRIVLPIRPEELHDFNPSLADIDAEAYSPDEFRKDGDFTVLMVTAKTYAVLVKRFKSVRVPRRRWTVDRKSKYVPPCLYEFIHEGFRKSWITNPGRNNLLFNFIQYVKLHGLTPEDFGIKAEGTEVEDKWRKVILEFNSNSEAPLHAREVEYMIDYHLYKHPDKVYGFNCEIFKLAGLCCKECKLHR